MKNSTKRIVLSVLTLVLTVVALGTTTFAWFSLSNVANVEGISGDVMGGEGLEVRIYHETDENNKFDTGFKSHLGTTEWTAFMSYVQGNGTDGFAFQPVTTTNAEEFKEIVQSANVNRKGHLDLADVNGGANKKYLEFNLEFQSLTGGIVDLTKLNLTGAVGELNNTGLTSDYLQTNSTPGTGRLNVETSPASAARVAFLGHTDVLTTTNVFEANNVEYTTTDKVVKGNHAGQDKAVEFGQWSFLTTAKNLKIYDGIGDEAKQIVSGTAGVDQVALSDQAIFKATEVEELETTAMNITLSSTADDTGYHKASVTVRIWLEGWDADTYDAIFLTKLAVEMFFEKQQQ